MLYRTLSFSRSLAFLQPKLNQEFLTAFHLDANFVSLTLYQLYKLKEKKMELLGTNEVSEIASCPKFEF